MKLVNKFTMVTFLILIQGCFDTKYELDIGEDEERGIRDTSTGEFVVAPAVIGFENEKGHYFGYRLPKQDVMCDWKENERSNTFTIAKLDLKPVYFSLNLDTGLLSEFTNRGKFNEHLQSFHIELGDKFMNIENSPFVIHYKKIYKDYDFSKCFPVES
ncbi:hypothetical protein [Pseudoalteromonas ruthenica]|uniref:Lipoprotein n=1 Tax=Pseudoalteromonas ruthenica TaxID=151081 RepID=A0A0F4PYU9_9GAMM|nr:hypothetical protein [Pseudoalteromonas ruthenica]KJY95833.1 hypothetical protein TW76_14865 [Pseudoalteromonas ruthenica]KJZ00280.1 hypothetical protein TW72_06085 [Pseudoalteromonas ruthenica]TMO83855.1 hypothetical protein CWC12_19375 [Pseudoalteromonas ruthenica]TMO90632.1 hypothetical protein CWC13_18800 [Pseudoalteromonas ruthenica]TMO96280.1 hypothetical protein CWC07_17905 [Pseudoalteromonas ruthenica]